MKVVYKGQIEKTETGCIPCGARRKGESRFVTSKSFHVPSGKYITFHIDQEVEVSDRDGRFLLEYNYEDINGLRRRIFEVVQ